VVEGWRKRKKERIKRSNMSQKKLEQGQQKAVKVGVTEEKQLEEHDAINQVN